MDRRTAIGSGVLAASALTNAVGQEKERKPALPKLTDELAKTFSSPTFIATWPFSMAACEKSLSVVQSGGSLLDAIERGINVTELDASISSVGYGGLPNADGVVQLDASFMDGAAQKAGAVAALEGYPNPISVARRVMETTKHVMLAGEDAAKFAESNGFKSRDMLTESARAKWEAWKASQANGEPAVKSHDTIALLGRVGTHLAAGCSTSGLAYKLPGRVGDSPIIGSGMYVDGEIGAAGATGVGENVLRYCGTFMIVEYMRLGLSPNDAIATAIKRIAKSDRRPPEELSINFVAINKAGVVGAGGTDHEFRCAVIDSKRILLCQANLVR